MNFKPTFIKSIVFLFSGLATNYLLSSSVRVVCLLPANDSHASCPQPNWADYVFDPVPIMISLVVIVLVYVVWSLVQKK